MQGVNGAIWAGLARAVPGASPSTGTSAPTSVSAVRPASISACRAVTVTRGATCQHVPTGRPAPSSTPCQETATAPTESAPSASAARGPNRSVCRHLHRRLRFRADHHDVALGGQRMSELDLHLTRVGALAPQLGDGSGQPRAQGHVHVLRLEGRRQQQLARRRPARRWARHPVRPRREREPRHCRPRRHQSAHDRTPTGLCTQRSDVRPLGAVRALDSSSSSPDRGM